MNTFAIPALLLALAATPAFADDSFPFSDTLERAFRSGGRVRLDLSAGDYDIRRGTNNVLRIVWHTRTAEQLEHVRVRADVNGEAANIVTDGPDNHFRVVIELPQRTDLFLRMSAGDLSIEGVEGNKDVRLRAGDLRIDVGDGTSYSHVDAAVTAGDLSARPFGFSTGGLWRSFNHEGSGRFRLRARLWAGDLRLISANPE